MLTKYSVWDSMFDSLFSYPLDRHGTSGYPQFDQLIMPRIFTRLLEGYYAPKESEKKVNPYVSMS